MAGMFGPTTGNRGHQMLLLTADVLVTLAAGTLAAWIRFPSHLVRESLREITGHPWFLVWTVCWLVALATTFDLYRPVNWRTTDRLLVRLFALALTFPVVIALGVYGVPSWRFGRGLLVLTVAFTVTGVGAVRFLWRRQAARLMPPNAVLIGKGPIIQDLEKELARSPAPPFQIIRRVDRLPGEDDGEDPRKILEGAGVVIVGQLADSDTWDRLAELNFSGITVLDAAGAFAQLTGRIPVRQVDARWFIASGDFSTLAGSAFHHVQRLLDLAGAVVLLVLGCPLLGLAAIGIMVTSGRPVFYRQVRLGRFRRPFVLYKLRTMQRNAEPDGPRFATDRDSRVLPVGRMLRRWRIDEMPQLLNVIKGDMSLVGPRPERPEVAEELERIIPFYGFRYSVRPGITGWAQVNHNYCAWPEDHILKLEYDLYSLRHYGATLYGLVLLRTLGALVFRPGR